MDLTYATAGELAAAVAARTLSPVEVVDAALARIDAVDPLLNCFCEVWVEEARAAARTAADAVVAGGPLGPLHSVPVAVKDTTPVAGHRITLGSVTHADRVADRDAAVVRALRRAGAVLLGTTTTPEFAHTLVTDSPLWGVTRNPWDLERTPGGSSGGSAAAVAAGCVPLAEGSDMGGSVRIPAAWCGVVGLKPGLGRIPMDVLPGLFDTLSHHGPLARCVDDARRFLQVAQGPDDADIWSQPVPLDLERPVEPEVRGLRVAVSLDLGSWSVDPAIRSTVRRTAEALAGAGAAVDDADLVVTAADERVWVDLWGVFLAAYYGELVADHEEQMDPHVVRLIRRGQRMGAVEYKRLELARTDLWRRIAAVFADHDVLLCPTMSRGPVPALPPFRPGRDRPGRDAPDDGRLHGLDMTSVFNLVAPCPAISIPGGSDDDGLPVGVQVVGRRWREDTVLRVGAAIEALRPPLGSPRGLAGVDEALSGRRQEPRRSR